MLRPGAALIQAWSVKSARVASALQKLLLRTISDMSHWVLSYFFSQELQPKGEHGRVSIMSEVDPVKRIITPFLTHGICKNETEALHMLARDYAHRQVVRYAERAEHFRSLYQTSVAEFALQVQALCEGRERILALNHLAHHQQAMQAEDDLEEWQTAEEFLARWQAVVTDLQHAAAA